ncbi:right-handed parallel beta-helix repeat-containing protein [Hymenobacter guriensis]|uniref:Right-handed parallel beta-helix repeat-containing protein n=1 Tax=Hymenobacter guriensis TaxID=2793065 RepID=A0ABS0L595_9BACT|nr:right-handed parallel beta-helix repeat-containing protein [Hymenobacter guriensis]MBG8555259.1 right-handed parallel beta-helix repeat-containing protein [Hymenobacter guriensis]
MRFLLPLLLILSAAATLLPGCEPKEDLLTTDRNARLEFSTDTVLFDTVFTQVGTASKRLWVYNRNARAVRVEQLRLAGKAPGTYSLIINGDDQPTADGLEIRGKDSVQILVKAVLGQVAKDKPFLVEDELQFRTNGNEQRVKLVAYGQNAYFHAEETLKCDEVWRNDKPHVIFGYALVEKDCRLTIEAGTRIYSHAGAALVVRGQLRINPDLQPSTEMKPDDPRFVRFQADRLEPFYNDIPGQWAGIQLDASSHDNVVRYAEIKNAAFGLVVLNLDNAAPRPAVLVENSIIKNISAAALQFGSTTAPFGGGILSFSGDVTVNNSLFTNCGEFAVAGFQGGRYVLNYCTVANYTPQFNRRETSSLTFSDELPVKAPPRRVSPEVTVRNSIIWGSFADELYFENAERYLDNISVTTNLLRTKEYTATASSATKPGFNNGGNVLNQDPKFKKTYLNSTTDKFDFRLDTLSPASNKAVPLPGLEYDLLHVLRDQATPDMGAYERKNP